jgi:hypothetical protein
MKKFIAIAIALAVAAGMSACGGSSASEGQKAEHSIQSQIEDNYAKGQPVPALTNSQVRQNLIEIEEAIAEGVQTTSFFFNMGVTDPIKSCTSIGVPIAATAQLTNPDQIIKEGEHGAGNQTIPQMDPTGIYTGETAGTYVLCISPSGEPYVSYWEGFVMSEFAGAKWNYTQHRIEIVGPASWEFSKHTAFSGTTNNPNK